MEHIADIIRKGADEAAGPDDAEVPGRKGFADEANVSLTTVGRWISGELEPSLDHCRRMLSPQSRLPAKIKAKIVDWMLWRTGFRAEPADSIDPAAIDINGDGVVDTRDAVRHALMAIEKSTAAASLLEAGEAAKSQQLVRATARDFFNEAIGSARLGVAALDYESRRAGPRAAG